MGAPGRERARNQLFWSSCSQQMPSLGFAGRCQEKPPQSHLYFEVRNSASLVHTLECAPSYQLLSAWYEHIRTATLQGWSQPGAGRGTASPAPRKAQAADARAQGWPWATPVKQSLVPYSKVCTAPKQASRAPSCPRENTKRVRMGRSNFLSSSVKYDCKLEERESEAWHFHMCHIC